MAGLIRQTDNIGKVLPSNPSRDGARRKQPRKPPTREQRDQADRRDGELHRIDEYV